MMAGNLTSWGVFYVFHLNLIINERYATCVRMHSACVRILIGVEWFQLYVSKG